MSSQQPPPRILIVDDEPEIRSFMSDALGAFGYLVRMAAGANEAFALAARTPFDLVICDLGLPGLEGAELIARLRGIVPAVPVIMLTGATPDDQHVRRVREAGLAVLHKPVGLLQLHRAVMEALAKGRS